MKTDKKVLSYIIMILLSGIIVDSALSVGPPCNPDCDSFLFDWCRGEFRCIRCSECSCTTCTAEGCQDNCGWYQCKYCKAGNCPGSCSGCATWCSEGQTCCNGEEFGTCYDPETQKCCGGHVIDKTECMECQNGEWVYKCSEGQRCCEGDCYWTSTHHCCWDGNGTICKNGENCCDGECYNPLQYECCDGELCDLLTGHHCCYGVDECYNTSTHQCCNGQIYEKGNCMDCIGGIWAYRCHPELCEECVNDDCLVCGGRENEYCCNGECVIPGLCTIDGKCNSDTFDCGDLPESVCFNQAIHENIYGRYNFVCSSGQCCSAYSAFDSSCVREYDCYYDAYTETCNRTIGYNTIEANNHCDDKNGNHYWGE